VSGAVTCAWVLSAQAAAAASQTRRGQWGILVDRAFMCIRCSPVEDNAMRSARHNPAVVTLDLRRQQRRAVRRERMSVKDQTRLADQARRFH
jgi:hypothetical protein